MNYIAIGPARQMAGDAKRLAAVIRALNCPSWVEEFQRRLLNCSSDRGFQGTSNAR